MKNIFVICLFFLILFEYAKQAKNKTGDAKKKVSTGKKQLKRKLWGRRRRFGGGGGGGDRRNYGKHCRRKNWRGHCIEFIYDPNPHSETQINYYEVPDPVLRNPSSNENTCDLQIELYPMYYTPILKSLDFRIKFSSNCMQQRDLTFEIYFQGKHQVNWNYHPSKVKLILFGNEYPIKFSNPIPRDQFDVMRNLEYTTARFQSIDPKRVLDIKNRNETYLFPQKNNTFTAYNIAKIQSSKLIVCQIETTDEEENQKERDLGILDDYQRRPPKEQGKFGEETMTSEQRDIAKQVEKLKKIQELKKKQFKEELELKNLDIICRID